MKAWPIGRRIEKDLSEYPDYFEHSFDCFLGIKREVLIQIVGEYYVHAFSKINCNIRTS